VGVEVDSSEPALGNSQPHMHCGIDHQNSAYAMRRVAFLSLHCAKVNKRFGLKYREKNEIV
jgi:hypothetical protein